MSQLLQLHNAQLIWGSMQDGAIGFIAGLGLCYSWDKLTARCDMSLAQESETNSLRDGAVSRQQNLLVKRGEWRYPEILAWYA